MFDATTDVTNDRLESPRDALTDVLRQGAERLLAEAIEAEVDAWISDRVHLTDESGRRLVVRNGHQPTRKIQTGVGSIEVTRPRVHDRRAEDERELFESAILPRVSAADEVDRGTDSLAVPQGRQQRRLPRGAPVPSWVPTHQVSRPTTITRLKGSVGGRVRGVERTIARRQALRLRVGRRDLLQRAAGERRQPAPVHPGRDGRNG